MGKIIKQVEGIIKNSTLEKFSFWSPHNGMEDFTGKRFKVIQTTGEAGAMQPDIYLIQFEDGNLAEVGFHELVGVVRGAARPGMNEAQIYRPALEGEIRATTYTDLPEGDLVALECGDEIIASVQFLKSETYYYVASPLMSKDPQKVIENMLDAERFERTERKNSRNTIRAIAPHAWLPYILDDLIPEQRKAVLEFGLMCLERCKGIVVHCENGISNGMRAEIKEALNLGLDVECVGLDIQASQIELGPKWEAYANSCVIPFSVSEDVFGADLSGYDMDFELSISMTLPDVRIAGRYTTDCGKTGSIKLTNNDGVHVRCITLAREECLKRYELSLHDYYLKLSGVSKQMTKGEAVAILQVEALVYEKAKKGECWRPGGCFHNSNGSSYISCNEETKGICDCFKENRYEVTPGHRIMSSALHNQGLCNYELLKNVLTGGM